MYDANASLQALVTKTTSFDSAGYNLSPGSGGGINFGTPRRGLKARVIVSAYSSPGTAGTVFTFNIQDSSDNTTFQTIASGYPITGATAAGTAQTIFIPFETSKRYVRLSMSMSPSSGTPTISYLADIGNARP